MATDLTARVQLSLDADPARDYCLPGEGSRSMLYVFDGHQIGARAESASSTDFTPASEHADVALTFWAEEARSLVAVGTLFEIWYGGIIGRGVVQSVAWLTKNA